MKRNELRIFGDIFAFALAFAFVSMFSACSEKVAGGSSDDSGIYAVKDLDVAGVSQKGPFVKGSAVTVQGIDCQTMELIGEIFEGTVKSDKGDFGVDDVNLSVSCALFEVTGHYFNEVTGKKSAGEVTLHALSDLSDRKHVNINMLTELEYRRVMHLVSEEKMSFDDAKKQAEKEVLASFNVNGNYALSEDLNIFEKGNGNAALLAVSVLVQVSGDSSKNVNVAERVDNFGTAIAKNGTLGDSAKTDMADWAAMAESNGQMAKIRKNLEDLGYAEEIPAFENVVEEFAQTVIPASSESFSSFAEEFSSSSDKPYTPPCYKECMDWSIPKEDYLNPEIKYGEITDDRDGQVYKTVKIGNQVWMAQNLNYFTSDMSYRASCHGGKTQHCDVAGRLYTWAVAMDSVKKAKDGVYACGDGKICTSTENYQGICPDGWHLPTKAEWDSLLSFVGGMPAASKILKSRVGWNNDGNGLDVVGFSALPAGDEFDGTGAYRNEGLGTSFWSVTEYYSVGAQVLRLSYNDEASAESYDLKERSLSIRCINDDGIIEYPSSSSAKSSSSSVIPASSGNLPSSSSETLAAACKTGTEDNCEYGEIVDERDGQTYKTVKIGDQIWMAENLNYAYTSIPFKYKEDASDSTSWCYNNDASNCKKYGRLYTWATAMDSSATWSDNGKNCGYGVSYSPTYPVQGICPSGWHLPSEDEWRALLTAVGGRSTAGKVLKSRYEWNEEGNGTDEFGFAALPAGFRDDTGKFIEEGEDAFFWGATIGSDNFAFEYANSLNLMYYSYGYTLYYYNEKYNGLSVRCVKN